MGARGAYGLGMSLSRWREVVAALRWIVASWLRPADADAAWEQDDRHYYKTDEG